LGFKKKENEDKGNNEMIDGEDVGRMEIMYKMVKSWPEEYDGFKYESLKLLMPDEFFDLFNMELKKQKVSFNSVNKNPEIIVLKNLIKRFKIQKILE